jgi:hypothetical protein
MGTTTEIIFCPVRAARRRAGHNTAPARIGGIHGMAATVIGNWWREFGDNDLLGWAITVAYFVAAALCFRAARRIRRERAPGKPAEPVPPDPMRSRPKDWAIIGVGMVLLGLNKQLDLQIFVREIGTRFIHLLGLDAERRWFGRAFVLLMGLFLLRVLWVATRRVRLQTSRHRMLLIGLALLASFAVIRAGTYVPVLRDIDVSHGKLLHFTLELGGVVVVGASAWATRQRLVRHQSSSISSA